jgi:hypothetical protein
LGVEKGGAGGVGCFFCFFPMLRARYAGINNDHCCPVHITQYRIRVLSRTQRVPSAYLSIAGFNTIRISAVRWRFSAVSVTLRQWPICPCDAPFSICVSPVDPTLNSFPIHVCCLFPWFLRLDLFLYFLLCLMYR